MLLGGGGGGLICPVRTCLVLIACFLTLGVIFKARPLRLKQPTKKYTLIDSPRFSHSDCGSSHVKTYANKRTLLEEK